MGGSKGGGGPAGTTTSVQDTSPWGPQQPYLKKLFEEATRLYDTTSPQYYPTTTLAGPNWAQLAATDVMMRPEADWLPRRAGWANEEMVSGTSPEALALKSYLSGDRIGKDNPYTTELTSNVLSKVVPQLQSRFISGGTLGSPEAARATSAGAMGALAPLLFQQQQQEEQNQINASKQLGEMRLRALALAPQTDEAAYAPYRRQLEAGTLHQQWQQAPIDEAIKRWNWEQELPYQRLNQYIGAVTGNYGGSSVLTQPYFRPPGQSPLSTIGQGIGVASSLFGLFSDRRLKDDIKPVGKLDNGLRVYSYRYKDDPDDLRRIGLMADEVEDVHPEAVATVPFGSLAGMQMVDYARATE